MRGPKVVRVNSVETGIHANPGQKPGPSSQKEKGAFAFWIVEGGTKDGLITTVAPRLKRSSKETQQKREEEGWGEKALFRISPHHTTGPLKANKK